MNIKLDQQVSGSLSASQSSVSPIEVPAEGKGGPANYAEFEPQEQVSLKVRFLRWLFPGIDRRRASRHALPGLVAFHWTGGSPHSNKIANISATGLYLHTEQRWAPETQIQLTLQSQNTGEGEEENALRLLTEVVRWGPDGAGFEFLLEDPETKGRGIWDAERVNKREVEKFLKRATLEAGENQKTPSN